MPDGEPPVFLREVRCAKLLSGIPGAPFVDVRLDSFFSLRSPVPKENPARPRALLACRATRPSFEKRRALQDRAPLRLRNAARCSDVGQLGPFTSRRENKTAGRIFSPCADPPSGPQRARFLKRAGAKTCDARDSSNAWDAKGSRVKCWCQNAPGKGAWHRLESSVTTLAETWEMNTWTLSAG